jgi:predicted amino acid-binding ACT domain protein
VPDRPGVARSIFDPLADAGINVDMIVQNVGHGGATDLSFTVPRVELAAAKKTLEPLVRELGARELTTDASVAKVSIVGAGLHNAPGYAARMFGTLADARVNIEMISTSEVRITIIDEARLPGASRGTGSAPRCRRRGLRRRRLGLSRGMLAARARPSRLSGSDESAPRTTSFASGSRRARRRCVAVADEQTAGRGHTGGVDRAGGRSAPVLARVPPVWLAPDPPWRLAVVAGDGRSSRGRERAEPGAIRLNGRMTWSSKARTVSARSPGSSARPTALARPIRGRSSASGSTRPGSGPTSRRRSPRT